MDSPTLEMIATPQGGTATILSSRAADAYSRYAANGNAANVGRALSSAEGVRDDMRNLYAALDSPRLTGAPSATPFPAFARRLRQCGAGEFRYAPYAFRFDSSRHILRAPQKDGEWHVSHSPTQGRSTSRDAAAWAATTPRTSA
ncbi:MAG: hypothetical protein ACLSHC_08305 [Bilophila wadsworthia]